MSEQDTTGTTSRPARQHRRAESAAGSPDGVSTATGFIELPAPPPSRRRSARRASDAPLDALPERSYPEPSADRPDADRTGTAAQQGMVPQPMTRREARRLRELGLLPDEQTSTADQVEASQDSAVAAVAPSGTTRRADAPTTTVADPTAPAANGGLTPEELETERQAIAQEGTELAELMSGADHTDPSVVDPELLARQEALAARAAALNAAVSEQEASAAAPEAPAGREVAPERQAPIQAVSAHGLDSLAAKDATSRERLRLIVTAVVLALGLIALVVGLIMMTT